MIEQNAGGKLIEVIYIFGFDNDDREWDIWKLQRHANAPQEEIWDVTRLNVCQSLINFYLFHFSDEFHPNLGCLILSWFHMIKRYFHLSVLQVDRSEFNDQIPSLIRSIFCPI